MTDPRFSNSYNELTSTFAVRTFMNVMPMILEVLEKMKTEFYVEKNVCLSNGNRLLSVGPVDLFRLLSSIVELYKYCPHRQVIDAMLSVCYKLVANFLVEFRKLVLEGEDIDLDNYCALANSNIKFMGCMRSFLDNIKDMTGVPVENLQKSFQQNFLMKNFAEISNASYLRIQDLVKT